MLLYNLMKNKMPKLTAIKQKENGDFLVIESRNLEIFYLNETAKHFILLCDSRKTIAEIYKALMAIYEVDEKVLMNDIVDLVRDLQWKKLLTLEVQNEKVY